MSAEASRAVFVSYASEDAEAARRACDALRSAGVEVWFDQSALVGGDAWDQKIRHQIKASSLFVPVISAATQSRREGYFRREWKQAAARTHDMADGTPFILPIVIDATRDADALVPDEFRAVQWTRLPGGEPTSQFIERVKTLLGGGPMTRASEPVTVREREDTRGKAPATSRPRQRIRPWMSFALAAIIAIGVTAVFIATRKADPKLPPQSELRSSGDGANLKEKELPSAQSVAVLAFSNLSEDKANEYFSDGISEELLNVLAKVPGLKVTARTSAFHFKGKDTPIPEIAKQLGVAYVVEGSVRKAGNRVRITAQLIKAADGFHVWSDNFDRDLKDIFAVQDEIAGLIAKNLSLKLGLGSPAKPVDPEVFRLYLEGLQEWNRRSFAALKSAEALFEKVIALDATFARAHAMLADVRYLQNSFRNNSDEWSAGATRALEGVERALSLDPNLVDAYVTRATVLHSQRKNDEADSSFRRALALNPNSALARQRYGFTLCARGKFSPGLEEMELTVRLDPLAAANWAILAQYRNYARRWEEGLAASEKALAIDPDFGRAKLHRMLALLQLGRAAEVLAILRETTKDDSSYGALRLSLLARAGGPGAAKLAEPYLTRPHETDARTMLQLYLSLNRIDDAFAFLERTDFRSVSSGPVFTDSIYDAIRDDPRFLRKLEEAGILMEYREAWRHVVAWEKKAGRR